MKKDLLALALLAWPLCAAVAQDQGPSDDHPVKWTYTVTKAGDGAYDLLIKGDIFNGWVVYSTTNSPDVGPLPTVIVFDTVPGIEPSNKIRENGKEMISHPDHLWDDSVVTKFKGWVGFSTTLHSALVSPVITGYFEYQTCNDVTCMPPDRTFFRAHLAESSVETSTIPWDAVDTGSTNAPTASGLCEEYKLHTVDLEAPVNICSEVEKDVKKESLWGIFILGFLGGLLALLTPCVFPMIPLTVSFFTKGSENRAKGIRNALTYGGFILLIYLLFSLPFHILGGVNPEIFNEFSTNPVLNLVFFVIFIVFAISFFGFFEITLPSSWVNRMDQNASRFGGVLGIFFMAFTLALVSFSCTGPILGSLLAGAITSTGGAIQLTAGMGGFGLALALPFALFALFPGWLNSLPKSGSWLTNVKVVLGFVEVALAFKFLSTADLVSHWGLMKYELFLAIWVLCAAGVVLYLLGFIRFPHDSAVKKRSVTRWGFIVVFLSATIYLLTGFRFDATAGTFKSPRLLSGLAPAAGYSWIHPKECPHALDCYHDLCAAMNEAKRSGKPLMVDFTGYGCVNCRKMEEYVWSAPGVLEIIREKYVLVSLYVDDREKLPKEEQHIFTNAAGTKKLIDTKGARWTTLENETFHKLSQPWYALLSPDGKLLNPPTGTGKDPFSVPEFKAFLECGLSGMEKLKSEGN